LHGGFATAYRNLSAWDVREHPLHLLDAGRLPDGYLLVQKAAADRLAP
jgi:hypothetical protein